MSLELDTEPRIAYDSEVFTVADKWRCCGCKETREFSSYAAAQWRVDVLHYNCTCGIVTVFDEGEVIETFHKDEE